MLSLSSMIMIPLYFVYALVVAEGGIEEVSVVGVPAVENKNAVCAFIKHIRYFL